MLPSVRRQVLLAGQDMTEQLQLHGGFDQALSYALGNQAITDSGLQSNLTRVMLPLRPPGSGLFYVVQCHHYRGKVPARPIHSVLVVIDHQSGDR
ncbi:hypothetical protein D9M71_727590 [compost metagenome]